MSKLKEKTLIVGLGRTGLSCARYLSSRGITAAVTDSRENPPCLDVLRRELPDTALFLGGFEPSVFDAAERLLVSPGVPVSEPLIQAARSRGVPVIGDIELFAREVKGTVAAITGSNGKSTLTSLLGEMARAAGRNVAVGGNIGKPALELLGSGADLYLLELSSFQLETTRSLHCDAAVVLNLSADHMDRYTDLEAYAEAKSVIYDNAVGRVFNLDDPQVLAMREGAGKDLFFTLGEPPENAFGIRRFEGSGWLSQGDRLLLPVKALKIPGQHNVANALAALAMGSLLALPMEAMLEALGNFSGLPHRTQFVGESAGVRWYNDSKGTNVGACIAALEGFCTEDDAGLSVLILGGEAKGADFAPLGPVVERCARAVVLIGRDAASIDKALGNRVPKIHAGDMQDAVAKAADAAQPGDRVLLSPACASFDMFRDYQQRGEIFTEAVARFME